MLERALKLAEDFQGLKEELQEWLSSTETQISAGRSGGGDPHKTQAILKEKYSEIPKMKERVRNMHRYARAIRSTVRTYFSVVCSEA